MSHLHKLIDAAKEASKFHAQAYAAAAELDEKLAQARNARDLFESTLVSLKNEEKEAWEAVRDEARKEAGWEAAVAP